MAPKTVSVTVKLSKQGLQPPIFLAGSFSDPAWQPQEMQHTTNETGDYEFHKEVQVEEGKEYQYKFRVGEQGDWWMLNEESPTVTDDAGNRNNLLSVPAVENIAHEPEESKTTEVHIPEPEPSFTKMAEETPTEPVEEKEASDVHAVEEPLAPVSIAKEEETGNEIEESKASEIPAAHESIESSSIGTGEDTPTTGDEEDGTPEVHADEKPIEPATLITDAEIEELKEPEASPTEESIKPSFIQLAEDLPQKAEEETGPSELHTVEELLEPTSITKEEESAKEIEEPKASEIPIAEESVKKNIAEDAEDTEEQIKDPTEAPGTISEETGAPALVPKEESFVEELDHKLAASTEDLTDPISIPAEETVKEPDHTPEIPYLPLPEGSIEPASTPVIDDQKEQAEPVEDPHPEETNHDPEIEDKILSPSPTTIVDKTGLEPRHGDDFGAEATFAQKEAHHLRAQDALPDYIRVRHDSRTPELADVAAEVADSAALLDRDQPTPPISDELAGRLGLRRMSSTPIPEVASTAAEVADVAATLDQESIDGIEVAPARAHDAQDGIEFIPSGASTPEEDRAPLLPHECLSKPPTQTGPYKREPPRPRKPSLPRFEECDPNDPSIEDFPTEREAFFERLRKISERLPEDVTDVDIEPLSPNVGASASEEKNLQKPSPSMLAHQISPSLDSITEENDEGEESLSTLPASALTDTNSETNGLSNREITTPEVKVEPAPEVLPEKIRSPEHSELDSASPKASHEEGDAARETKTEADVPNITIQPATPFLDSKSFSQDRPKAKTTENDEPAAELASTAEESGPSKQEETSQTTQVGPAREEANVANKGVTFEEPGPGDPAKTDDKITDTAKSTGIEDENGPTQLKSRRQPSPERTERPTPPSSIRSAGKDAKSQNFLKAFWRVFFVDWIGGWIVRLCGGSRGRTILVLLAIVIAIAVPAFYSLA